MKESIDKDYWEGYYGFWDKFVTEWYKERGNKPGVANEYIEISEAYGKAVAHLELDELPTPYLGNPREGIEAVIINMNPGLSETIGFGRFSGKNSDKTQFYKHIKDNIGWLIREFRDAANGLYSSFVGIDSDINYSCLNPELLETIKYPDWVCGVNWWQGYDKKLIEKDYRKECFRNRDKRMPWLRQVYNKDISPTKVFALELCPYHSRNFSFDSRNLTEDYRDFILRFIVDHVIHPALMAVFENNLNFAVAIGKPTAIFLEQQLKQINGGVYGIEAKLEREWWEESDDVKSWDWPKEKDGATGEMRLAHRKYCLFALKDKYGRLARFLVTAAPGGNTAPRMEFGEKIEKKLIREYVRTNPLTKESYERIQPLENMRWWSGIKSKANSSKVKPKQVKPKSSKRVHNSTQDKTQLYRNLWSGFSNWCKENKMALFTKEVNFENNYIKPAGTRKPCELFKIDASGKLYLGIYCTKDYGAKIRSTCEEVFERINTDIDWGNQDNAKDVTILFPFSEDWRNPNEALFKTMAQTFESVRDVLRGKGFL